MNDHLDPKYSAGMLAGLVCLAVIVTASFFVSSARLQYENQLASVQTALEKRANTKPFSGDFPAFKFDGPSQREEALSRLADRLPEVAAWYGKSPDELKGLFARDKSLWMDESARLFYQDAAPEPGTTPSGAADVALGTLYPLEDTFKLHSRPGAKKIIYIDFDGMVLTNTAWNAWKGIATIDAPAWDIDGNPASFGNTERERIQYIWQRVSEDYAPFDIDVTTEAPPPDRLAKSTSGDEYYGTVVLVSPISQYFGNYGGFGYVGVLGSTYYQPALVFPERLAHSDRYIAEAVSHEAGHNHGLNHDGTTAGDEYYWGNSNWAPIMGGAYYSTVTQFSRGEYPGANNQQDDLAVITYQGVGMRADDCGATAAAACALTLGAGGAVSGSGVIERAADVDLYSFQTDAGNIALEVKMHPFASNLHAEASVVDASGAVVVAGGVSSQKVTLSGSVPGGTYFVKVKGVGSADFSDYASLGNYQISGTVIYSGKLPPEAVATAVPENGSSPLRVQFSSDGSMDPDGTIVSYAWQFGDGTSATDANPVKTYENTGTFTAVLTVTDNDGLTATDSVVVTATNNAPAAVITATPLSGDAPLQVSFDGSRSSDSDGTIASYAWQFGDGATAEGASAQHTYANPGTYTAKLTVTDNGNKSGVAQATVVAVDGNVVSAPTNLTASVSSRKVSLSWSDKAGNETEYRMYRWREEKRKSPNYTLLTTLPADSTSYSDALSTSGTYYYYVEAINTTTGSKAASSPVKVRVR